MNSSFILSVTTFVYGAAGFIYLAVWIFNIKSMERLATGTVIIGICGNIAGLLFRWKESYDLGIGHAPLSNLYESLVFFALVIAVLYLVLEKKYNLKTIGAFALPMAFISMAYASLSPKIGEVIQPLLPALKSNWLIAHVITCFIGYAAFALAFGIGLMFLVTLSEKTYHQGLLSRVPEKKILDELMHKMVMFGFLFLTGGIISGAVWANSAWGRYWGWDPKETWSLITWFIYATLLHVRFMKGWRGKRIAVFTIIGFIAVLFTYFGVNYLPGLHSYGS
ncbi:MAG: c-type cytochrome biogenesis protein CcsB [Deltaproteobacteria bacterium]|nr:c-type cytochrome biogenesis protein CcsB [Deltaproteobacteria bacterium]